MRPIADNPTGGLEALDAGLRQLQADLNRGDMLRAADLVIDGASLTAHGVPFVQPDRPVGWVVPDPPRSGFSSH